MAACQIRSKRGGGQRTRSRREKQKHKWREGERGGPQADVGIGGKRQRRRRRKSRNEMQRRSIKMRGCRRGGDWHVTADFSTICNVLCLSHTVLLFLLLTLCSLFSLFISLSLNPVSHDVNLPITISERRHPASFKMEKRLSRRVQAVNYRAVIDLSMWPYTHQNLKNAWS